jgi:ribose 5-phosphate isomerase B
MRVAIGSDHAGYHLKAHLRDWLRAHKIDARDVGSDSLDPGDDYPDFARAVAESVLHRECELGIMICSTGVGSCIAANKIPGVRAALCHDPFSARMSRLHNDANVLCLGANVIAPGLAEEILSVWLDVGFSGEPRHRRRIDKVTRLERSDKD